MSCYMIDDVDGAKQMRPIRTAAEYRDLRNSARQQAMVDVVRSMAQMESGLIEQEAALNEAYMLSV